ncbi:hypothetical protein [Streptomyces werraensis]|uniref:hypothetical protein n=1 Tax=Streptomyces werraensis TaxID=68284 RepID=UPI0037D1611C
MNLDAADEHRSAAAEALAMVAGHLATHDPGKVLDEFTFAALVGAKVYDAGGRSGSGRGLKVSRLALHAVGSIPAGVSRVEFAVPVAQAARTLGYDWTADDNRRVIPTIPGQRRGPVEDAVQRKVHDLANSLERLRPDARAEMNDVLRAAELVCRDAGQSVLASLSAFILTPRQGETRAQYAARLREAVGRR